MLDVLASLFHRVRPRQAVIERVAHDAARSQLRVHDSDLHARGERLKDLHARHHPRG